MSLDLGEETSVQSLVEAVNALPDGEEKENLQEVLVRILKAQVGKISAAYEQNRETEIIAERRRLEAYKRKREYQLLCQHTQTTPIGISPQVGGKVLFGHAVLTCFNPKCQAILVWPFDEEAKKRWPYALPLSYDLLMKANAEDSIAQSSGVLSNGSVLNELVRKRAETGEESSV